MSDLLARLIAAGTPADLVAEVAMLAARAQVDKEAIETRRTKDRERQAARRNVTSRDIADVADTTPTPSPSSSPDPSNNPTPAPVEHTPRARRAEIWPVPAGVEPRHWADFLANRKRKRLANSQTAFDGVMRDLAEKADAHWPPGALVEHAAAKGWGSINYPSHQPRNGTRYEPIQSHRGAHSRSGDGFGAALREMSGSSPPHH